MRFTDQTFLLLLPKIKSAGSRVCSIYVPKLKQTTFALNRQLTMQLTLSESLERGDAGSLKMPRRGRVEVRVVRAARVMILGIHWGRGVILMMGMMMMVLRVLTCNKGPLLVLFLRTCCATTDIQEDNENIESEQ